LARYARVPGQSAGDRKGIKRNGHQACDCRGGKRIGTADQIRSKLLEIQSGRCAVSRHTAGRRPARLGPFQEVHAMKIVLIDPPHQAFIGYYRFYFPLGLVSVGSMLETQGHEVIIIDAEHLPEGRCLSNAAASKLFRHYYESLHNLDHPIWLRLRERLLCLQPDIVGITVLSCKVDSALVTARLVRGLLPNAKIMVGGDHTVFFAKDLAADQSIDAVVIGEGEQTAC
jgi:hypothetical protein